MSFEAGPGLQPPKVWSNSGGFVSARVARPLLRFMHLEMASGVMLAIAALVALVWVNSPWGHSYHELWELELNIGLGDWQLMYHGHPLTLHEVINDGLMVLFFFVVGLEIKRELVSGHLVDRRAAALPAIAAVGGMVVPALTFLLIAGPSGFGHGWGIPMATDIAFAVGVLSLVGDRVPAELKVFLLTLAIVDDIGAIIVIALFYSSGMSLAWLAFAAALVACIVAAQKSGVRYVPTYALIGIFLWYALLQSGVHATIAGVICGLLAPAKVWHDHDGATVTIPGGDVHGVRQLQLAVRETVPVTERLEALLHPFTAFVILPVFALANAGVELSGASISEAVSAPVTAAVALGLVLGKTVGITVATLIAVKLGVGRKPGGVSTAAVVGVASLAGIGFTVAMFVAELAFDDQTVVEQAKVGILAASLVAAVIGLTVLKRAFPPAKT